MEESIKTIIKNCTQGLDGHIYGPFSWEGGFHQVRRLGYRSPPNHARRHKGCHKNSPFTDTEWGNTKY